MSTMFPFWHWKDAPFFILSFTTFGYSFPAFLRNGLAEPRFSEKPFHRFFGRPLTDRRFRDASVDDKQMSRCPVANHWIMATE
jgi:hypothetical protein